MKAFPEVKYIKSGEFGSRIMAIEGGMDLRDYFAAKAMQGWIVGMDSGINVRQVALFSYQLADEMMKAREQ